VERGTIIKQAGTNEKYSDETKKPSGARRGRHLQHRQGVSGIVIISACEPLSLSGPGLRERRGPEDYLWKRWCPSWEDATKKMNTNNRDERKGVRGRGDGITGLLAGRREWKENLKAIVRGGGEIGKGYQLEM